MAHDVRSPHIFVDGPGHTASGDQVMDNFDALWAVIDTLVSPGTIRISGATSPETGWLLCNGAAVSRTTYSALFAKLGTAFGVGDGSTTFNLPDLTGRAPVGSGTGSGLSAKTLGAKIGTEPSNMPSHQHSYTSATLVATLSNAAAGADFNVAQPAGATTGLTGSGSATDGNVPPSTVVNFFIKT